MHPDVTYGAITLRNARSGACASTGTDSLYAGAVTQPPCAARRMTRVSVASPLRLATEAGLDAGRRGGNAIDAALTTAAVLTVAYPASCAIGGDLLALVREPDGHTTFIDASGRAPIATDVEAVRSRHREMPIHGPLPVTVPGMVGGWSALAAHGAALPWRDLLTPAQAAAAEGIPVSAGLAESIAETVPELGPFPDLASLLCPGGSPLTQGQTLRQPALARTLGVLAEAGPSALYDGELTAAFCAGLAERGVPMTRCRPPQASASMRRPRCTSTPPVGGCRPDAPARRRTSCCDCSGCWTPWTPESD